MTLDRLALYLAAYMIAQQPLPDGRGPDFRTKMQINSVEITEEVLREIGQELSPIWTIDKPFVVTVDGFRYSLYYTESERLKIDYEQR